MKKPVLFSTVYLGLVLAYIAWPTAQPIQEDASEASGQALEEVFPGTVPNRDAAIEKAKQEGKTTYKYVANFVPGVGIINQQSTSSK